MPARRSRHARGGRERRAEALPRRDAVGEFVLPCEFGARLLSSSSDYCHKNREQNFIKEKSGSSSTVLSFFPSSPSSFLLLLSFIFYFLFVAVIHSHGKEC